MPKKTMQGTIVSLATPQTAKVSVEREWQHPIYLKRVKRSKSYACHYDKQALAVGDIVVIEECRPISRTKKFRVVAKVQK